MLPDEPPTPRKLNLRKQSLWAHKVSGSQGLDLQTVKPSADNTFRKLTTTESRILPPSRPQGWQMSAATSTLVEPGVTATSRETPSVESILVVRSTKSLDLLEARNVL